MAEIRNLHKGKCLEDLRKFFAVPELKRYKLKQLLSTAQKAYEAAEKNFLDGDEEMSYIYYMKYFNLLDYIRHMPEYRKNKELTNKMLGSHTKQTMAFDKCETLSNSLRRRYQLLAEHEKVPQFNSVAITKMNDRQEDENMNNEDRDLNMKSPSLTFLQCVDLAQLLQNPSQSILIMDCRPKTDFEESKIKYNYCVNIPEEIILPGKSAGMIQNDLDESSKVLWASRKIKDQVILIDWNCNKESSLLNTPIGRLRDILQNWDIDVTYRSPILIVDGGYEQFVLRYPMKCTNPSVKAPKGLNPSGNNIVDDIEYPSLGEITMKDEITFQQTRNANDTILRPEINRSSKATAIQNYEQKKKYQDLLEEREKLLDKQVENAKNILNTETDLTTIINENLKEKKDESDRIYHAMEQEYVYNLMQFENKERDYKLENDSLKEELQRYKDKEKELKQIISENEEKKLKEATRRIEIKEQKKEEIAKECEKVMQERQKQQQLAKEVKRQLKPPLEEGAISKPKIPQFDRATKPIAENITERVIVRDFSPVPGNMGRGLTGLKNLGNTCYMNSIMQCLSNTSCLAEYFVTNNYKKHINTSNKTKGKIVEEVAALIKMLWKGQYKCIAIHDFRYVIGQYQQMFRGIEQQDSHEFLTILMDWLHSDLQTLQIDNTPKDNLPAWDKAWLDFSKYRESMILRLFYGQIKSTVKCIECSKESATYECFSNISLELPQTTNRCNLTDCLTMYFSGEKIKGWNCPNCKQKRDAIKKLNISKLPPILVIHLKRFYADPDAVGNLYKKQQNFVSFPLEVLNMTEYITKAEMRTSSPKSYHLYGVSNHYGSMESGHYTAFCKSSIFGRWFKFDDQVVSPLDSSDVVSSAAYILFYTYMPDITPREGS